MEMGAMETGMTARSGSRRLAAAGASMGALALSAGLGLSACAPPHPHLHAKTALKVISSLDCPDSQGDLTRKSAASDGKSCVYAGDNGDEVTLRLISLDGKTVRDALAPIEADLRAEVPVANGPPPPGPPNPPVPPNLGGDSGKDRVDINLPGIHIHAHGDGGADIDTGGVHIQALDHDGHGGDRAVVQVGDDDHGRGVNINANDGGAQIRVDESGSSVRAHYILASEHPGPHGYKSAGYEVRGPNGGPVAVAVALTKSDDGLDDLRHDVRDLLRRNVGG
jgi:hypothetical protein